MSHEPPAGVADETRAAPSSVPHEELAAVASQEFRAASPDQRVAAVVSGAGEVLRLEVSALATQGAARDLVAGAVVSAVNAALDAADAARRALMPGADEEVDKLDEITEQISARMGELRGRLDDIGRRPVP